MPVLPENAPFSSSPAFGTPALPIPPARAPPITLPPPPKPLSILPIRLPPGILRPHAFRVFTKKHNLTLASSALADLAAFIGRHCGAGWREEGLADPVLEEVARSWKKSSGNVIVEGESKALAAILKTLDGCMSGGRITQGKTGLSRQTSFRFGENANEGSNGTRKRSFEEEPFTSRKRLPLERQSFDNVEGQGNDAVDRDEEDETNADPRQWVQVVGAFEQPKLAYDTHKKNFDKRPTKGSMLPPPSHKTEMFRQRYHVVHQRLLHNESFQAPTASSARSLLRRSASSIAHHSKLTPVVNLLGRSGSAHLLLGLLSVSPAGTLTLSDLTGSIALDLQHARPMPDDGTYFTPGMIVLVDGTYTETHGASSGGAGDVLGSTGGIGGTIGGKFVGSLIGHPPPERRTTTLGTEDAHGSSASGPAFGWTDFLGLGSERAVGTRMRRLQSRLLNPDPEPDAPGIRTGAIAIAAEVALDSPNTLSALRSMLNAYASQPAPATPLAIVLMGNFTRTPPLAGVHGAGSIEYKESFDALASVLTEFPQLVARTTFVFVPGDRDAWAGAGAAGASTAVPRKGVPDMFTGRVRRAVADANREEGTGRGSRWKGGEAIWTSNPARLSHFGPIGEMVLFRDDMAGRLRRANVRFNPDREAGRANGDRLNGGVSAAEELMSSAVPDTSSEEDALDPDTVAARRLTKTVVDQAHLSPFALSTRPVHWDYAHALQLYPLPSALVVADVEVAPFALTYMGCCVMNPGTLVPSGRRGGSEARWVEYNVVEGKGSVRSAGM